MSLLMRGAIVVWLFFGSIHLYGQQALPSDFCTLRVTVRDFQGAVSQGVPVVVRSKTGVMLATSRTGQDGRAEFCDLPLGLFDVAVGVSLCGQVIVRDLFDIYPYSIELPVLYENCHGAVWSMGGGCDVLLRVIAMNKAPLAGASVKGPSRTWSSDQFGRVRLKVPWDSSAKLSITKQGYVASQADVVCGKGRSRFEEVVELATAKD